MLQRSIPPTWQRSLL